MMVAERAGVAARKVRLEGLQAAANDFWALLCDYSMPPSVQRITQQARPLAGRVFLGYTTSSGTSHWKLQCKVRCPCLLRTK